MNKSITVYCGSGDEVSSELLKLSFDTGFKIAERQWRLVYGGSTLGMMGQCAEGALSKGGEVYGITLNRFTNYHHGLSEIVSVETMRERKKLLSESSDALIALPGGLGTLEELTEIMVERSYSMHEKPLVVVNYGGFWTKFLEQIDFMREQKFITKVNPFIVVNSIDEAFEVLDKEL